MHVPPAPLEPLLKAEARRDVPACAAELRTLAGRLRGADGVDLQGALTDWLLAGLDLVGPHGTLSSERDGAAWREAVWDSAVDVVADGAGLAGFLELAAERLEQLRPDAKPNLLSMLRARAHWRARDRMRQRLVLGNQATNPAPAADNPGPDAQARLIAGLAVQGVARKFEAEPHLLGVLLRLLQGESISEVAEGTGVSRQAIYRGLARVREWLSGATDTSTGGVVDDLQTSPRPRRTGGSNV